MRVGLLQTTSSDEPRENAAALVRAVARAAGDGAELVMTPEVSNCVSADRAHQRAVLRGEDEDTVLSALREAAAEHGVWVLLGSIAVATDDPDGRFANRSVLIDAAGDVVARYDKIHMFDVAVSETETYRESAGFRPGNRAVLADTPWGGLGMTICYDIRFPHLYRQLARAGAAFLSVPAAFSPVTGAAHWDVLLRARAIETGCFVLAPAQTGAHPARAGRPRRTWGHSMVVDPWGEVLLDAGDAPGIHVVDIEPGAVDRARARIPSVSADRDWIEP